MKLNLFNLKQNKYCFAFYNIENLFDIYNEDLKHDSDFTDTSEKRWTLKRYKNKITKISFALSQIGLKETKMHPAIVGLAEVENQSVLKDLTTHKNLKNCNYNFVHFDSKDERGIDVAFLYDTKVFTVLESKVHSIVFKKDNGNLDYTRDILHIYGSFLDEKLDIIVNHWPSRRDGNNETAKKRMTASNKVTEIITNIRTKNENAKIIVMGDFNDDPSSNSIKSLIDKNNLYNAMDTLLSINRGTTIYRGDWNLFDQIICSVNCFNRKSKKLRFDKANIFDVDFLKQQDGNYKGAPYRTYIGKQYKGGYSDHFPVYTIFKK